MKRLFLILAALALLVLAQPWLAQPWLAQAQLARDTLDASKGYFTVRVDSILDLSSQSMKPDSIFQADPKRFPSSPVVQLQIDVASSGGRADTIIVKKRRLVRRMGGEIDTLWVPVPIMALSTAGVDTIGIIAQGPHASQDGGSYRTESFLVYDAFMDGKPWRVERRSGKGHPLRPDTSPTHVLIFDYWRRAGYNGGPQ